MAKATKAPESAFTFAPTVDPAQVFETVRTVAEDNLAQSKANFEKAKAVLDDMQKETEAGMNAVKAQGDKLSAAAIGAVRSNTEATLNHFEKLMGVKSVAELVELQTAFIRAQAEAAVDSAKTMQTLYQEAGTSMAEDAKAMAEKTMKSFKA